MFKDWNWKQLALPFLLLVALLINKSLMHPPAPKPADADPAQFSAERAMEHVRMIATEPHAVGTPANKRVRDDLIAHLQAAGLETEIQSTQILDSYRSTSAEHFAGLPRERHSAAFVHNIIGRLKGTGQTGKALVLMSHYDSVYYGPGAGDDASGTATLLETLRALQASEPLQNDIIFLITDAEEVGLFGAQAFFEKHRWANDVGLVLNFEARGSGGPVNMFQTGALNNKQIEIFSKAVDRPHANALTVTIYREMPNDTDMSISLAEDIPGMNFAFIDGFYDYHTKGDNADNLSTATLQHMGDQALAMTRALGNQTLPLEDTSEVVFFDFLTLFLVSYPVWLSWAITGLAVVALIWLAADKIKQQQISLIGMLKGAAAAIIFFTLMGLIIDVLYLMIGGRSGNVVEARRLFALANEQLFGFSLISFGFALAWFRMIARGFSLPWITGGILLSILLFIFQSSWIPAVVALALTLAAYFLLRSPIKNDERLLASFDIYLLAAMAIQFMAPAGSYLFFWPFILVVTGLILHQRGKIDLTGISFLSLLAGLWFIYLTESGYSSLGVSFPSIIVVPLGLLMLMLVPTFMHITRNTHRTVATISSALGLILIGYAAFAPGFSDRLNQPTEVFYTVNSTGDGANHFGTRLAKQDKWSEQLMKGQTQEIKTSTIIANRKGSITLTDAPVSNVQSVSVVNPTSRNGKVSFTLMPGYRGDFITASFNSSAPITNMTIGGETLRKSDTPPSSIMLYYFAVPEGGLEIAISTTGEVSLHATEVTSDWPEDIEGSIPLKPSDIMVAPYRLSDSTISSVKHVFKQDVSIQPGAVN